MNAASAAPEAGPATPALTPAERHFWQTRREALATQYAGQFVAVVAGHVVAASANAAARRSPLSRLLSRGAVRSAPTHNRVRVARRAGGTL